MWNNEITLITQREIGKDSLKQPIIEKAKTVLLCRKRALSRSEFYQANQAGLRPSLVVDVRSFEYNNEELAEFEGRQYKVLKTYPVDLEVLELTLMEVLT